MLASQLIQHLEKHPTLQILIASDAEGNTFSSFDDSSIQFVDKTYQGGTVEDVWDSEDLLDEVDDDADEASVLANFKQVLVLWPV